MSVKEPSHWKISNNTNGYAFKTGFIIDAKSLICSAAETQTVFAS